jgi:hypothetical protein
MGEGVFSLCGYARGLITCGNEEGDWSGHNLRSEVGRKRETREVEIDGVRELIGRLTSKERTETS